ncbi:MAG: TonB C-terminal domain-containing protein [Candidatus Obscuribacterales bacterium]|nr:TonB C-terminal domain-containing protein [Candidatus Obscuribacterales bacterium]
MKNTILCVVPLSIFLSLYSAARSETALHELVTGPTITNEEELHSRQKKILAVLDPSHGKARCISRIALSTLGLHADDLSMVLQLSPWFKYIQKELQTKTAYESLNELAPNVLPQGKTMVCAFSTNQNGKICDLKVTKSSGSKSFDDLICSLIESAAPLKPAPNELPEEKDSLYIEFYVENDRLELTMLRHGSFPTRRLHEVWTNNGPALIER